MEALDCLRAIDKFDLSYEVQFSTYAVPMISGEIRRFLRDDGMIKVSRSLRELSYKSLQAREKMTRILGREPTLKELSEELQIDCEEIVQAMESSVEVESIYKPIHQKEGSEILLMDKLEEKDRQEEKVLDRIVLKEVLETLEAKERTIIYLRYFAGKTQADDRKKWNVSGAGVKDRKKGVGADAERNEAVEFTIFSKKTILLRFLSLMQPLPQTLRDTGQSLPVS